MTASYIPSNVIQRHFSRAASYYHKNAMLQRNITETTVQLLKENIGHLSAPLLLDIGCGTGFFAEYCLQHHPTWKIIQSDFSYDMARAARHNTSYTAVCADMQTLPFLPSIFDAIFSSSCLQWVSDPLLALKSCHSVLKPSGVLCLTSFGKRTLRELSETYLACHLDNPTIMFQTLEDIIQTCKDAGFSRVSGHSAILYEIHPHPRALLTHLRKIGANVPATQPRTRQNITNIVGHYNTHFAHESLASSDTDKQITIGNITNAAHPIYASYEVLTIIAVR